MQHAQPGTLAQHLLAWASMLVRDWERLEDSLKRIEKSPLGSGALQGSTLPLDRELVAKNLDFPELLKILWTQFLTEITA